jgi:uncharacterized membrane protein
VTARGSGLVGAAVAAVGLAVAGYLSAVKLAGTLPVCGPLRGCETVALSSYSELAGVPVALFGVALSAVLVVLQLVWWQRGDRRALGAAYGLGLVGVVVASYLTYLELFVIHAVCAWCVTYAVTVVLGWAIAALAWRASSADPRG